MVHNVWHIYLLALFEQNCAFSRRDRMVSLPSINTLKQKSRDLLQSQPGADSTNVGTVERRASLLGGSLLTISGLALAIKREWPGVPGIIFALIGCDLIYRGIRGHSYAYQVLGINTAEPDKTREYVDKVMTISRPLTDFVRFRQYATTTSQVYASTPSMQENPEKEQAELEAWNALQQIVTANSGRIEFNSAPNDRGTEVRVQFEYTPPAGKVGSTVLKLQGKTPKQEVSEALRHFKSVMETGEVLTTEGQPVGPR
jgi:uncharacterized membrane protein